MKKALSIVLSLTLGTSLMLAACSKTDSAPKGNTNSSTTNSTQAPAKPITLTFSWWGNQPRHDATLKVNELYKQKNPNVTIESTYQPFDGYFQKLAILAAANNMPDVFQFYVGSGDTQQFYDKNLVEPLDDYVGKKIIDTSTLGESAVSAGKLNGKLYGVTLSINSVAMLLDPDIYQKAGLQIPKDGYASWADVEKDLVKLKGATGAYGADDMFQYNVGLMYYLRANGQSVYSDKSIIGFDEKTYSDFYTMKKNWIKNGLIPPYDVTVAGSSKGPEGSQIVAKKAGMSMIWASAYPSYAKAAGKQLVMVPFPGPNSEKAMDLRTGMYISMSSDSKNKEEAAKFINFFVNDVDANKIINAERGMPASSKVREALKAGFTPEQKEIADYLDIVAKKSSPVDPPAPQGSTQIDALLKDLEQQIVFEKVTTQDAYKKIKDTANSLIKK